jgi:hypothetical protein
VNPFKPIIFLCLHPGSTPDQQTPYLTPGLSIRLPADSLYCIAEGDRERGDVEREDRERSATCVGVLWDLELVKAKMYYCFIGPWSSSTGSMMDTPDASGHCEMESQALPAAFVVKRQAYEWQRTGECKWVPFQGLRIHVVAGGLKKFQGLGSCVITDGMLRLNLPVQTKRPVYDR